MHVNGWKNSKRELRACALGNRISLPGHRVAFDRLLQAESQAYAPRFQSCKGFHLQGCWQGKLRSPMMDVPCFQWMFGLAAHIHCRSPGHDPNHCRWGEAALETCWMMSTAWAWTLHPSSWKIEFEPGGAVEVVFRLQADRATLNVRIACHSRQLRKVAKFSEHLAPVGLVREEFVEKHCRSPDSKYLECSVWQVLMYRIESRAIEEDQLR